MKLIVLFTSMAMLMVSVSNAQSKYAAAVEHKIKEVESSLVGWVQTGDTVKWTLDERMKHYGIRGVSIAVIHNYKVEWAKGYGWADSAEGRHVTNETLFETASIAKSINGMGILKLAQDGLLDLNADINQYLTSWKFPYDSISHGKKISTMNLLSHTAGTNIESFDAYEPYLPGAPLPTTVQILKGEKPATNPPLQQVAEPGLQFSYSSGGVAITQLMVEDILHKPYAEYMYKNVLSPLHMNATIYQPPPAGKKALLATSYFNDGKELSGKYHNYPSLSAAGMWSNPTDLSKFVIETQLALEGKSNKVLNENYTQLQLTPYIDKSSALGVFVEKKGSRSYFSHEGSDDGFMCQYLGSTTGGDGVVIMMNTASVQMLEEVANAVALTYHWEGFYQPSVKKIISLSSSELQNFAGTYQFQKNKDLYIKIEAVNGGLQATTVWDNKSYPFFPESGNLFFSREVSFMLNFKKDESGKATQIIIFDTDVWDKVK